MEHGLAGEQLVMMQGVLRAAEEEKELHSLKVTCEQLQAQNLALEETIKELDEDDVKRELWRQRMLQVSAPSIRLRQLENDLGELQTTLISVSKNEAELIRQSSKNHSEIESMQRASKEKEKTLLSMAKKKELLAVTPSIIEEDHEEALERLAKNIAGSRSLGDEAKLDQIIRLCKSLEKSRDIARHEVRRLRLEAKASSARPSGPRPGGLF